MVLDPGSTSKSDSLLANNCETRTERWNRHHFVHFNGCLRGDPTFLMITLGKDKITVLIDRGRNWLTSEST